MTMIRTETQVPSNYYARSRDFQLLGRLFDLVANSSKNYADCIADFTDGRFAALMARTVGFCGDRKYDAEDLASLYRSFKSILRRKGTESAIKECAEMLMHAQNIGSGYEFKCDSDACVVTITLYDDRLQDISLLEDMLEYVLPAGWLLRIVIGQRSLDGYGEVDASVGVGATVTKHEDANLGNVYSGDSGDTSKYEAHLSTVYQRQQ